MDRLIVKNFGPLKDIDIELNKINIFIGENGSGKSVLAKLINILNNPLLDKGLFQVLDMGLFQDYNIDYFEDNTIIKYTPKDKKYFIDFEGRKPFINNSIKYSNSTSQYIPAERTLISIFNKYVTTFITADIPLPKFLLNFSSQYIRARESIQKLNLLNVEYQLKNGQEYIFYNNKESLLLEHSSSGIQSALPLYLTVKYFAQKYGSILIEEPEQNLFPKAQKETVEYIIEQLEDKNRLFMMTHSPYILTALNNLILANDVKNQKGLEAIDKIVKESQCVAFEDVRAYNIVDGRAIDIMDIEDRLIGVNLIDSISDEVNHTFDTLLSKLD